LDEREVIKRIARKAKDIMIDIYTEEWKCEKEFVGTQD